MSTDPYATARAETKRATITMDELADDFGISVSNCYERARRGELPIPVERIGKRYIIKRADRDRYFGEQQPGAPVGQSPAPLTLVAHERSEQEKALAAIDRRIADAEHEIALWQSLRGLIVAQVESPRAVS